jgi:hypothetical protein
MLSYYRPHGCDADRGRRGHDRMVVGFTTICEFKPVHVKVYSIQHYMIKFDSDL